MTWLMGIRASLYDVRSTAVSPHPFFPQRSTATRHPIVLYLKMSAKQTSGASTAGVPSIGAQSSMTPSVPITAEDVARFTSRISFAKQNFIESVKSLFQTMLAEELSRFHKAGGVGDPTLPDPTTYVAPSDIPTAEQPRVKINPDPEWDARYDTWLQR